MQAGEKRLLTPPSPKWSSNQPLKQLDRPFSYNSNTSTDTSSSWQKMQVKIFCYAILSCREFFSWELPEECRYSPEVHIPLEVSGSVPGFGQTGTVWAPHRPALREPQMQRAQHLIPCRAIARTMPTTQHCHLMPLRECQWEKLVSGPSARKVCFFWATGIYRALQRLWSFNWFCFPLALVTRKLSVEVSGILEHAFGVITSPLA